jgi:LPS-assembly protein
MKQSKKPAPAINPQHAFYAHDYRARLALLAAAFVAVSITASGALAQNPNTPAALPPAADGGAIEADAVQFDDTKETLEASGNVVIEKAGQVLRADKVKWNQNANQMNASGSVNLQEANGSRTKAARMVLDNSLAAGEIYQMRMTLPNEARLGATSARSSDTEMVAEGVSYTACPECDDPDASPFWQLRAQSINYDKVGQNVSYKHMRLEVAGVPVLYAPYFVHPGPEVVRRSGFLMPSMKTSDAFGTGIETPYYFNIAPQYDLTMTPRFSEKQDPYLVSEWRHLTQAGTYEINTFMHHSDDPLLTTDVDDDFNFGIKAAGHFVLDGWHTSLKVTDANDDLFFRRYKIDSLDKMESNAQSVRYLSNGYVKLAAHKYRSALRDETDETVDEILPSVTHRLDFAQPVAQGQLSITSNLQHNERNLGLDITEAKTRLNWERQIISANGLVWEARNTLQLDAFHYEQEATDPVTKDGAPDTLAANSASLHMSYPLEKVSAHDTQTLTPEVQLVVASNNDRYEDVPYSSAAALDLSRTSLFQFSDPKDEASRVNYGLTHEMNHQNTLDTRVFVGQSYNLSSQSHAVETGYGDGSSALITRAEVGYGPSTHRVQFNQDLRADPSDMKILRNRTGLRYAQSNFSIGTDYAFYDAGQNGADAKKEQTIQLDWQMAQNWRFETSHRRDLEKDRNVLSSAQLVYEDICTILNFSISRDYASVDNLRPETTISFTFVLKTLGGTQ